MGVSLSGDNKVGIGMTSERTRKRMVDRLRESGVSDEIVLQAMNTIPRHFFVEEALASRAYDDVSLPIGSAQTISRPLTVARSCELARHQSSLKRVLEIGTGCGYQAAVLSRIADEVYSIERIKPLLVNAQSCFKKLKLTNIIAELGDGFLGWPKLAPFDHMIITCAVKKIDDRLLNQVRVNGSCIVPIGKTKNQQRLMKITIGNNRHENVWEDLGKVSFVPLITEKD